MTTSGRVRDVGIQHDEADLTLLSATMEGTDAHALVTNGFELATMDGVQTCLTESCSRAVPGDRREGGGWVSAVVPSFLMPVELPIARITLAKASYALARDVGPGGTTIRATDELATKGGDRFITRFVVNVRYRLWTTTVDGWVKRRGDDPGVRFLRGDVGLGPSGEASPADGATSVTDAARMLRAMFFGDERGLACRKAADVDDDGEVLLTDVVYLLGYLFLGTAEPPPPFEAAGEDPTPDGLDCARYP